MFFYLQIDVFNIYDTRCGGCVQVVRLCTPSIREELITSLREMLRAHGRQLLLHEASTKLLLDRAVTKKKRQEMLGLFFRCVFTEVILTGCLSYCISIARHKWCKRLEKDFFNTNVKGVLLCETKN